MNQKMTVLSEHNIAFLKGENKTPQQISDFLNTGAEFRSFAYLLSQFCHQNLKDQLVNGLVEIAGEEREAVARKVRNWLNGINMPKNREALFQICFALKLKESESSKVLGMFSDTGIHYRNPKELAYAYALRMGKTYPEAVNLKEKAVLLYQSAQILSGDIAAETPFGYTRRLQEEFRHVSSDEEFFSFFKKHGRELGMLHETAYKKFMELLKILQNPESEGESFTLDQVMQNYLRLHVPVKKRKSKESPRQASERDFSVMQKLVKKCWPNEAELVRMRTRKKDVSRKALLLLYLATQAFDTEEEDEKEVYFFEDLEEDADTMLEIRWKKMDLFLDTYGMNRLDPGNPFDFLLLYALRARSDEDAWDKMGQMMERLFD